MINSSVSIRRRGGGADPGHVTVARAKSHFLCLTLLQWVWSLHLSLSILINLGCLATQLILFCSLNFIQSMTGILAFFNTRPAEL